MNSILMAKEYFSLLRLSAGLMAVISGLMTAIIVIKSEFLMTDFFSIINSYFFKLLFASLTTISIVSASMSLNDYIDYNGDKINGRKDRPLIRQHISKHNALTLSILLYVLSFVFSILASLIKPSFNLFVIVFINLIFILLSISYSVFLKKTTMLDNLTVSILYSGTIVWEALIFNISSSITITIIFSVTVYFIIVGLAREILKDIMDMEGDKSVGGNSIPLKYGIGFSSKIILFLNVISIIVIILPLLFILERNLTASLLFILFFLVSYMLNIKTSIRLYKTPGKENSIIGRKMTKLSLWSASFGYLLLAILI